MIAQVLRLLRPLMLFLAFLAISDPSAAQLVTGISVAMHDDLGVARMELIHPAVEFHERLQIEVNLAAPVAMVKGPGDSHPWPAGDFVPASLLALWALQSDTAFRSENSAARFIDVPAAAIALTVLQPRLVWRTIPRVELTAGWGSEWHAFGEERGLSWRPTVSVRSWVLAQMHGALALEVGACYNTLWSFDRSSRGLGWGWYFGMRMLQVFG